MYQAKAPERHATGRQSIQRHADEQRQVTQRKEKVNLDAKVNGISNRMAVAYTQMFGYSPHDAGVTVKHTSASDPALQQVGARSMIQRNAILCSNSQDLGHELVHSTQQNVKPTQMINGQPVNTDASLEREADVKGAQLVSLSQRITQADVG